MKKGLIKEATRLQQLAGILKESDLGAAYAERELDGDASRQMHEQGSTQTIYDIDESQMEHYSFDIAELIDAVGLSNYQEGVDYELGIARGDDFPHAIEIKNAEILQNPSIVRALEALEEEAYDEEEDYEPDSYDWDDIDGRGDR